MMKKRIKGVATNYPVGDFLIRVKNMSLADAKEVQARSTKMIYSVAKTLERLGYLHNIEVKEGILKANIVRKNKESVLTNLKLVSKPGLRVYMDLDELGARKKPSSLLISTSKGILSSKEALSKKVGGEVIAEVL